MKQPLSGKVESARARLEALRPTHRHPALLDEALDHLGAMAEVLRHGSGHPLAPRPERHRLADALRRLLGEGLKSLEHEGFLELMEIAEEFVEIAD